MTGMRFIKKANEALERKMYHTQEKRWERLTFPILCKNKNAWLGTGYYFWYEEVDAIHWGNNSKNKKGHFEIYSADIDCKNVLDTVFNEQEYIFWKGQIEKVASTISEKTGKKPTLKEVNEYLRDKAKWIDEVDGILFQDLPYSSDLLVEHFNYRKRIQIAIYKKKIIDNFMLHDTRSCF
ncbi:hypothetical protein Barb6_01743 [Bacteroidales bacterium Barb6]|nr:hypothetical protein Barb6_01743 [Bacteroidales bacterium Barb6]